jgi:hypothetical protein
MSSDSIKKELSTYLPLLSIHQKAQVLDMIKSMLQVDKKEKRVSIAQYNTEIELALKEVKEGKSVSHEQIVANSKKWLKGREV